jgi:hypothetical protein
MSVMNKIRKLINKENAYSGIIESLVGSIITLIAMAGTGLAINGSIQMSMSAQNYTKAAGYIQEVLAIAKNTNYPSLGVSTDVSTSTDNTNTINVANSDVTGCNTYATTFENETHYVLTAGLPYCQIKTPISGVGTSFNVETHVTTVSLSDITNDITTNTGFNSGNLYAKRVTVIVTWWEGKFDSNKLAVMRSAQSEMLITPTIGFCPPSSSGIVGACNN